MKLNDFVLESDWSIRMEMSTIFVSLALTALTGVLLQKMFASSVYDWLIVDMTKVWYKTVLNNVSDKSTVLDIGIGTCTALLKNKDILEKKNIKIIGVDREQIYITSGEKQIKSMGLDDRIKIYCKSLYDKDLSNVLDSDSQDNLVDNVYFSGSWSLLPDPVEAIRISSKLLKNSIKGDDNQGSVYITQTFQKSDSKFIRFMKPLMKYITTVDFGNLTLIKDVEVYLEELSREVDGTKFVVQKKEIIEGSINNMLQAAYLIKLKKVTC